MAFGTLFDGGMTGESGQDIHVYVDREGYSGTTYTLRLKSDKLIVGQNAGGLFTPTRRSRTATTFVAKGAPIQEAKVIPRRPYGTHRVRVEHGGTEVYRGYVDTDKTTTSISEQRGLFTIRARVGLSSLSADWRTSSGSLFSGEFALSTILADIFDAIGLAAPIDAVLEWRPEGMADTSDPLSIKAQAAAWQRDNSEGQTQVLSRGEVLSDVVGIWGASLFFEDGVWRIRQPTAYQSASSVTVHQYDSTGTHTGTTSRAATVDISGDPWERDSDEVSGVTTLQKAEVVYEHGAPQQIAFNGDFEEGTGGGATGWTFPTADFDITTNVTATSDSERALKITGDSFLANSATLADMQDAANETAETTAGGYSADSEEVDLTLNYRSTVTPDGGIDGDQPELIRMYWAVKHVTVNGTTYWLTGGAWTKESNLGTLNDRLNGLSAGAFGGAAWQDETITIPSPPASGTLSLELSEPVSKQQSDEGSAYTFTGYWDEIRLSRALGEGPAKTLFRASAPDVSGGDTLERTFRIGDGPYEQAPGALKTPSGEFTGPWRVIGESGTYALHELYVKEVMAALRGGAQLIRAEFREPTSPEARKAISFDSLTSWPVQVDWDTTTDVYSVSLMELRDEGHPPNFVKIAGGEDSFSSSSGSNGTATVVGTWDQLSDKPGQLVAKGGGNDGYSETIAINQLEAFEYNAGRLSLGTGVDPSTQSSNSSALQELADRASGGNKILQLPSGVIEHDEPIHFYDDGSNNFNQYGKLRLEGVTDHTRSSTNNGKRHGTTLKYTGDPSKTPYQFGGGVFESQRYRVSSLNLEGTTNENVPLVKVQSTFQRSDFHDLYVVQNGQGHGMIVRDAWVSSFERIFCVRPNASSPHTNGIGFQFHNRDFAAGNVRLDRITGSGFRYGIVVGGLTYGEGAGNVTTHCVNLQGQNCYVGIVHGFGGSGGHDHNLYAEGCDKASYWVINRAGRSVDTVYSLVQEGASNIQLGMRKGPGPDMPFTGTVTDDVTGALRDTNVDFGTDDKAIAVGDVVYNTTGSKPYPRAFVSEIKTERQRGNGASGAVHELTLTQDIFGAGDTYSVSSDLDDYTATASQLDSSGNYDGETIPTASQAAARGATFRKVILFPYNSIGLLYHSTSTTKNNKVDGLNGSDRRDVTTSASANKLIDSSADFLGGFYPVEIGDNVVNRDTGKTTTVTDVDSATQLDLADDIFASGDAYAVSGATIVYNYAETSHGLQLTDITNRDGVNKEINQPDFSERITYADDARPDRQLGPTESDGVTYENFNREAGTSSVEQTPSRTWEQFPVYSLEAYTQDTTLTLPEASNSEVQKRVIKVYRSDDNPNDHSAKVTAPNGIYGPGVDGNGALVLNAEEGFRLQAIKKLGVWRWHVLGSYPTIQDGGSVVASSVRALDFNVGLSAIKSGKVVEANLAMEVKENGTAKVPNARQISFDGTYFDVKQNSNNQFRPDISFKRATLVDGGGKEIDAAELAGDDGASGQVLETDGSSAQWTSIEGKSESAVGLTDTIVRGRGRR